MSAGGSTTIEGEGQRRIPAPANVNPENQRYFDAASLGKLLVKQCVSCGEFHFHPRAICPFCFSDRTDWVEAKGRGTIYSVSVLRRGAPAPYAVAYVKLDEGVTMMTNIVDCDLDALHIGDKVRVVFKPSDSGQAVPMFTPA